VPIYGIFQNFSIRIGGLKQRESLTIMIYDCPKMSLRAAFAVLLFFAFAMLAIISPLAAAFPSLDFEKLSREPLPTSSTTEGKIGHSGFFVLRIRRLGKLCTI